MTFAEVLRRHGYATGYAGKWHLDGNAKPGWSPARKFGFEDNRYMFNRGHYKQLQDTPAGPAVKARNKNNNPTYDVSGADVQSFTTDFLADKTVAYIQAHRDRPFCFVTSIPDPHGPNTVRPPYDTMFASLKFQQPRSAFESGTGLPSCAVPLAKPSFENMSRYFGMVKCIDDNVGKILAALRAAGVVERTIVVFTSDHGDMCGEHGRVNKGISDGQTVQCDVAFFARGANSDVLVAEGDAIYLRQKRLATTLQEVAAEVLSSNRSPGCRNRTTRRATDCGDSIAKRLG